ncbi:uncharacterized protein DUF1842 [Roseibium hamelinense]|uniref:Uncharacterized protein DUF1842 n=2 Tax=Roseibium hamelinense TaxID=150831 RepID=A0A562SH39_9HYPH|nr:DUF1842 domain-containing protein [Roseibium hamelinense]MTI44148.1 DUF1842 domain-containing protein [Roseibium hamelinense]TWI80070.1 uncharacterized protein DUF1842 [Roseibium hamelinense]
MADVLDPAAPEAFAQNRVGLFLLKLQSVGMPGAPTNTLMLTVYAPTQTVTGHSSVHQAINPPLNVESHVSGNLIFATVMDKEKSRIRIDLAGWPEIRLPGGAGIGPVIPENYNAQILLKTDYSEGTIRFRFRDDFMSEWHSVSQEIKRVD